MMEIFQEQISTDYILLTFIYMVGALSVLLVVLGLGFIDMGLVRARNVLDTWVQKLTAAMVGGFGTMLFGYGLWEWQFNQAFDVPNALYSALQAWWIGGPAASTPAMLLDPAVVPEADVLQVFLVFFVTFTMATMALIHSSAIERIKAKALYIMAFIIGALLSPLVGYLCWGPLSPLTNSGVHDFEGVFPLYIFSGTWSLVLAWRLGPRRGAFGQDPAGLSPIPSNYGFVAAGVMFIMFALPFIAVGSTFIIPDKGVYGISFTQTGLGLILINMFAALLSGGLVGAIIGYMHREPRWVFLGPIAGAVMSGTLFDIGTPLQAMAFGTLGPLVALTTAKLVYRLGIDEQKVVPLALGPGVVGALLVGFLHWGTPTGGYPGLSGEYALGHAQITPWWQLAGIAATMAVAGIPALILCLILEKLGQLRVSPETEMIGLDAAHWGVANCGDDLADDSVREIASTIAMTTGTAGRDGTQAGVVS
ncbi:ammonium transporter [Phytohalomonas tamaricis]|uniref:ammonium transporter n=1 Tax=Phytohalomonas tamaricis TaxID=2081032 RepID=UPI0021D41C1D|nr:ammonium transporter [Phytohalomonas tamaricis]